MKLRAMNGPQAGTEYQMDGMSFTIGREEGNDIIIAATSVSRRHCRFLKNGEFWTVEDLQSLNGVYVNNMKIKVPTEVFNGDIIRVHESEFRVEDGANRPLGASVSLQSVFLDGQPKKGGNCLVIALSVAIVVLVLIATGVVVGIVKMRNSAKKAIDEHKNRTEVISEESSEKGDEGLLPENALDEVKAQELKPSNTNFTTEDNVEEKVEESSEPEIKKPSRRAQLPSDMPLIVYSDPSGANIYVDKRLCGTTPALIKGISNGKHTLELSLHGYEVFKRQIETPEPIPSKPYKLILKSGVTVVNTDPQGAWVWEGRKFRGTTPLIIDDFDEGKHTLEILGPGCERHVETIDVSSANGRKLNITLKSMFGSLEVTSQPSGCTVYLDGASIGKTPIGDEGASSILVDNILEGRHFLKVVHSSGIYSNVQINVKRGETVKHEAKIWLPTHRLVLKDGKEFYGILIEKAPNGNVVLELINSRKERFINDNIDSLEVLDDAALKALVDKTGNEFKFLMGNGGQTESGIIKVNDFIASCENANMQAFKGYQGRLFRISGVPTALMKEREIIVITFGAKLKCYFAQRTPNKDFDAISNAKDNGESIVIQGNLQVRKDDIIIMNNCILLAD